MVKKYYKLFCVVNINMRYAFVVTVDYVKNVKAMQERERYSKNTRVLLNNKDSSLVLRSFKRIQENMTHEALVCHNSRKSTYNFEWIVCMWMKGLNLWVFFDNIVIVIICMWLYSKQQLVQNVD